ncbi:MAG: ABC transporter permease [Bacillota bacterium]
MTKITDAFVKDYLQEDASFITDKKLGNLQDLEARFNILIEEGIVSDYSLSEEKTIRIFSAGSKLNLPAVIEGEAKGRGSIMLDPAFAKANKLEIGSSILIHGRSFEISGYMSLPNYIYPLKEETDLLSNPNTFGIAVISREDFDTINTGISFYSVKFKDNANIGEKINELKEYLRKENIIILRWTNINENPRVTFVSLKIDGMKQVSTSLPIAILLLSCILAGIVMWRMLKKEAVTIGTIYALGYRRGEIIKHYLMYPLVIALTGGTIGTLLGALTLRPMLDFMAVYFNLPLDAVSFDIVYVFTSIMLPVAFLCISGYLVVNRALMSSPVDLMKGGKDKGKVGFIEKKLKLDRLSFSSKFKVREQLRSIPRSMFLLLGVAVATMLLLFGFVTKSSMDYLMKESYNEVFKYEYEYVFNSLQLEQAKSGEIFSISPFTLKEDEQADFAVYGIQADSKLISLKDKNGNPLNTNSIIITKPLADKLALEPKDTIRIVNKLDAREYSLIIDSIAETYVGETIYMPLEQFNTMLDYPTNSYMGLWSTEKLDIPENQLLRKATIGELIRAFEDMTAPMQKMLGMIAFMSFIIGLLVIYVVTSLIIEENKESISLMKIFGYNKKEVYSLILNSSSFIIVAGYIIGIPMLLASLRVMFSSMAQQMNFTFPVRINYIFMLAGFVVIYLTYELSKHLSKKKVNRISMQEALKAGME